MSISTSLKQLIWRVSTELIKSIWVKFKLDGIFNDRRQTLITAEDYPINQVKPSIIY